MSIGTNIQFPLTATRLSRRPSESWTARFEESGARITHDPLPTVIG